MSSVYPSITVMGAHRVRAVTFNTSGVKSQPILTLTVEDEHGFPLTTVHVSGLPAETMRRLVKAVEVKEPEAAL